MSSNANHALAQGDAGADARAPLLDGRAREDDAHTPAPAPAPAPPANGANGASPPRARTETLTLTQGAREDESSTSTSHVHGSSSVSTTRVNAPAHRPRSRFASLDLFRGLIVMIMAWDHTTHQFTSEKDAYPGGEGWNGPFATYDDSYRLFLYRAASHVCAPGFFLTMGMGMTLFAHSRVDVNGWTWGRVVRHYLARGLVLVALAPLAEIPSRFAALVDLGVHHRTVHETFFGNAEYHHGDELTMMWRTAVGHMQVLTCLGLTMTMAPWMFLAPLRALERARGARAAYVGGIAAFFAVFAVSNALIVVAQRGDPADATKGFPQFAAVADTPLKMLARLLAYPGLGFRDWAFVGYSVFPWIGITALGFGLGFVIEREGPDAAHAAMRSLAAVFFVGFFMVRLFGGPVGNYRGWPRGEKDERASLEFWMTSKYPPDLAFALATLCVDLAFIYGFSRVTDVSRAVFRPLLVFGRTPLFFYILHFSVIGSLEALTRFPDPPALSKFRLEGVIPVWILVLCIMYPLCARYEAFKQTRGVDSVWRMF